MLVFDIGIINIKVFFVHDQKFIDRYVKLNLSLFNEVNLLSVVFLLVEDVANQ